MVLVDSDRIPRVPPYSGAVSSFFTISATGLSPCLAGLPSPFAYNASLLFPDSPTTPILKSVWALPFARRYLGNHSYFLFLQVLRCFSSLSLASLQLSVHCRISGLYPGWVPPFGHRRIVACLLLPSHFAVCCVLLRLSVPSIRHTLFPTLPIWCLDHYFLLTDCFSVEFS